MKKVIADRYELIELIGQGGMADVYIAIDIILQRRVAIKMLRTNLAKDPIYVTRFQREASAAASLSHKNIVEIYDVGEDGDKYFIVMEYVPGVTLKELIIRRGALHVVEAIDIMQQITSGASKAHQLGIVHRDLKPQNVFVTESGTAKIGDFGIASMESLAQVTKTDVIMGSLHYLAPELARGEKATTQSDIYALGIVLYELLRGEVPFHGESPVNIALKHMQSEIPSVCKVNPSIPQSVENIIIKATAKNLNNRYQSMSEMTKDLSSCLDRVDEPKVVFEYDASSDPTIVVEPREVFGDQTESITKVPPPPKMKSVENNDSNKKKKIIIGCIVGAIAAIAIVCALLFASPSTVTVPNVSGLTPEEALVMLEEKGIAVAADYVEEPSDTVETGRIIKTNPEYGSRIEKGQELVITVSSGKEIIIGDYVDTDYESAKKLLEELGFTVVKVDEASQSVASGNVISQSIKADTKIDPKEEDRTIELTVSTGKEIELGDYTGMTYQKAYDTLVALGFNVTRVDQESSQAKDLVIAQSANVGTVYKEGDTLTITLTVSSGQSFEVPRVVGISIEEAKVILEDRGFKVKLVDLGQTNVHSELLIVKKQSPDPFSTVTEEGTTVTIEYYTSYAPAPEEPTDNESAAVE